MAPIHGILSAAAERNYLLRMVGMCWQMLRCRLRLHLRTLRSSYVGAASVIRLKDRPRTRAHLLQVRGLIRSSGVLVHHENLTAGRG
jgi:hypothetical protein